LQIVLSATRAMARWLKHDLTDALPRLPSMDGKRVGTQSLVTDSQQLSWQCHVIQNAYRHGEYTAIVTEAYSRYTLLMPYAVAPTVAEFENELLRRWANDLVTICVEGGALTEAELPALMQQFVQCRKSLVWYRNTDLSVNGHVSDAEQWVMQTLRENHLQRLSDEDALGLGHHINQFRKKAKRGQPGNPGFYPVARLLDDGLFRFAKGLSTERYFLTPAGSFPDPYPMPINPQTELAAQHEQRPDNVVCLSSFRNKRR
jgi:hypothetical protein